MAGADSVPAARRGLEAGVTLGEALRHMTRAFGAAGLDTPGLDGRRLAMSALGADEAVLFGAPERTLSADEAASLEVAMRRRLAREPVSRIVGRRSFHGLALEIGPDTLDPRPETETLVDGLLRLVAAGRVPRGQAARIADLGTGTGAILLALLARLPEASGIGTDVSEGALSVARRNAHRLGLENRATFHRASWLEGVAGPFDLIVANPPYIRSEDVADLEPEVRLHDPIGALDGGPDGLEAYRAIAAQSPCCLSPGGWLVVEVGAGQASAVARMLEVCEAPQPLDIQEIWADLNGVERCVAAKARV